MKDILTHALLEKRPGRGTIILVGPRGAGKKDYIQRCLLPYIRAKNEAANTCTLSDSRDCVPSLLKTIEKHPDTVFVLSDIYLANNYPAIVDIVASHPHARLIATSNTLLPYDYEDRLDNPAWVPTASRGRVLKMFFPGLIWADYSKWNPGKGVLDYLFSSSLDQDILHAPRWLERTQKQKRISSILLAHAGEVLTNRHVARIYERMYSESIALNTVIDVISFLENFCFFHVLPRFDLRKGRLLSNGAVAYPVTVAMFPDVPIREDVIVKRAETALVLQWRYEGLEVLRACHHRQRYSGGEREFEVVDDGFLLSNGRHRWLVLFAVGLNENRIRFIKEIPSGYRKVVIVAEMSSPKMALEDGIEAFSLEAALAGGLFHD